MPKSLKDLRFFARMPEMRIFWFLSPALIVVFAIVAINLSGTLTLVVGGLLAVVGFAVFMSSYHVAESNFNTKAERNELKNIVLAIEDALIAYNQDFRVFVFNPAAEKLFALPAADVMGQEVRPSAAERPGWKFLAQVVFPSLAPALVYRSPAGVYPQVVDLSFENPLLELRVTTANIIDERGTVGGFMKIIHNRTQEVSLLKSKNEFITVASHQLRTPITEINWALETISGDANVPAAPHELIVQAATSAKKVMNIVEDLLNIAKIEEGRFGYEFRELDIVEFLNTLLGSALPQVQHSGIKLYYDRPKEILPHVKLDPQKISMVMSNLLDNATRYNVPNGQVVVRIRWSDDRRFLEASVKDTGIGIPPDEIDKVFSKFFRAANALKFQTDGSGLGLYIARNIIQSHGGQMWAESELNRGTTFFFTIPVDPNLVPQREVPVGL